jgi:hypothetical protein
MVLAEQLDGFLVFFLVDQGDIPLDAHMGRAGGLAGRGSAFADGICAGYGLGVFFVGGFSFGKVLVVFIANFDGTDFGAFAAAGAFGNINISGFLTDMGFKMSWFAVQGKNFSAS